MAAGYLTTTLATIRLTAAQLVDAAASGAAAAGQLAVGVASRAMAVGEGIATVASLALDLALSPIALTVGAVAAGVASSVWVWQHWSTVLGAVQGKFGPIVQGVAQAALTFAPFLGAVEAIAVAFHRWNDIMKTARDTWKSLSTTVHNAPKTVSQLAGQAAGGLLGDVERLLVPGAPQGVNLFGVGGGGMATGTGGGGLPDYLLPGRAAAVTHNHGPVHFHPGAITIHAKANHDPAAIAKEVTKQVAEHLSNQWRHGTQWDTTNPIGLELSPFGF